MNLKNLDFHGIIDTYKPKYHEWGINTTVTLLYSKYHATHALHKHYFPWPIATHPWPEAMLLRKEFHHAHTLHKHYLSTSTAAVTIISAIRGGMLALDVQKRFHLCDGLHCFGYPAATSAPWAAITKSTAAVRITNAELSDGQATSCVLTISTTAVTIHSALLCNVITTYIVYTKLTTAGRITSAESLNAQATDKRFALWGVLNWLISLSTCFQHCWIWQNCKYFTKSMKI